MLNNITDSIRFLYPESVSYFIHNHFWWRFIYHFGVKNLTFKSVLSKTDKIGFAFHFLKNTCIICAYLVSHTEETEIVDKEGLEAMVFPRGSNPDLSPLHIICCNDTCSFTWTGAEHINQVSSVFC